MRTIIILDFEFTNFIAGDNYTASHFPGTETGLDSLHRLDPAAGRWEQLRPENCTSPSPRSGFGLTATRNGSSWTFWLFGGIADSADLHGYYSLE